MIPIYKQLFVIVIPMKVMQPQSLFVCLFVFFLSGFSFTNIDEPLDCRGRGGAFL